VGSWEYTIEAWTDVFGTWRDELTRKIEARHEHLDGEMSEGIVLLRAAADTAREQSDKQLIEHALVTLDDEGVPESAKHDVALGQELFAAVERTQERHERVSLQTPLRIEVDRTRARFG